MTARGNGEGGTFGGGQVEGLEQCRSVSLRGSSRAPRSRSLTPRVLSPARSANASCVGWRKAMAPQQLPEAGLSHRHPMVAVPQGFWPASGKPILEMTPCPRNGKSVGECVACSWSALRRSP